MEQIYKYRSFSASIASGYKLFRSNIRTILAKSWIEAIVLGATFGLSLTALALGSRAGVACAVAAFVIALIFWTERLFVLIDGGTTWEKLRRSALSAIIGLFFLALPLVGVPLANVMMEVMLEEKPRIRTAFLTGLRHWGYLTLTLLMSGMIMALLSVVICIPLGICLYGLAADYFGVAGGDPSGLPESFPVILFFVGMLTVFILAFVQIWQTYALAYAHGAILTRDNRQDR